MQAKPILELLQNLLKYAVGTNAEELFMGVSLLRYLLLGDI